MLQPEIKINYPSSTSVNSTSSTAISTSTKISEKQKDKSLTSNAVMAKRLINSSDKSSGTKNLVGLGGSTLTGKNPFAILKASAIAASQKAVFPNNFTNLPKVCPPFLPPLPEGEKDKTYTLVLDLDETLIHNVEYGQDSFFLVRPGCE
jgi:hypothetical protein